MSTAQDEVFSFLASPHAWPDTSSPVEIIDTHSARVFLAGDTVLKVKRAVKLPYLDFSTLDARHGYCLREIALNKPAAPGLYRGVVAITRESDGTLAVGGRGTPVEYAVHMARFSQDSLLSAIVARGALTLDMCESLADTIHANHRAAAVADRPRDTLDETAAALVQGIEPHLESRDFAARMKLGIEAAAARSRTIRAKRGQYGRIRRCHGDLHLNNIVAWHGRPVPFDALEFDEGLATIDTLYDLAFLLMDLERSGARWAANAILNRYLWRSRDGLDLEGLAALPFFIGLRALVRARVTLDRMRSDCANETGLRQRMRQTSELAHEAFSANAPCALVAIGGLSGTGKTTLARAIAPCIGPMPGAVHLRSDMERKALAGVEPGIRLDAAAYTTGSSAGVYRVMLDRTAAVLAARHAVVVDAVFAKEGERAQMRKLADDAKIPFLGFWLEGHADSLRARVASRVGDASDATPAIVDRQLTYDLGTMDWNRVDASGSAQTTLAAVCETLFDTIVPRARWKKLRGDLS